MKLSDDEWDEVARSLAELDRDELDKMMVTVLSARIVKNTSPYSFIESDRCYVLMGFSSEHRLALKSFKEQYL